jgi:RHS repeat-associated protein
MVTASSTQNPMLVTNTAYNPASQPMTMTFGTGDSDSFMYDTSTDRMTQFKATINTRSLTGTIGWNAVGTPASLGIVDAFNAADTQNCSFGHDDLVRIAAVSCGTVWGQNFTYDPFGNVDKAVISGDAGTSFQANYSSSTNQISSLPGFTPLYDNDGNLETDSAHTYTWNSEARPTAIDSVMLTYDALNRIVEQGNGTTFTETVYSPLGAKFALMTGQTLVKAFAPLPDGAIATYTSSGLAYYRHPDWLGSSRLASTPSRTIYSDVAYAPFGEAYSQTGSTDPSFTGQNQDVVSGLFDFLYREYSPTQGRWVSPDPSGIGAVITTDPQSWNRYAYVRDSPLFLVDSLGLCDEPDEPTLDKDGNPTGGVTGHPPCLPFPGEPGDPGSADQGNGNTNAGGPPLHGIPINRKFSKNFACSSSASQVMNALESNFSGFANQTSGNTFSIFTPGPVSIGQQVDINVGLQLFGQVVAYNDVSVTVQSASSSSLVFQSTPSHVLYPATVSFSASNIGNGQINFTTTVNATTNGALGTIEFYPFGMAGETATWNNLLANVGQFCSEP